MCRRNNKGTEENRVRHMDYGVQFNKLMYECLITGGDITLFSPSGVPVAVACVESSSLRWEISLKDLQTAGFVEGRRCACMKCVQ